MTEHSERMAAGHRYNEETKTGIQWNSDGTAVLYQRGEVIETGTHATRSPYEFWFSLAFRETFPGITHWWFGSAWTGLVRVSPPAGSLDESTQYGVMQFVDAETQGITWTLTTDFRVSPPMPQFHVTPLNLPLRRQLAEMIIAPVVQETLARSDDPTTAVRLINDLFIDVDVIEMNTWIGVTSLVERDRLDEMFPDRPLWWTLEPLTMSLRQSLCALQGLSKK